MATLTLPAGPVQTLDKSTDVAHRLIAAQRKYKAAYEAHQASHGEAFVTTLDAWRKAWQELDAVEAEVREHFNMHEQEVC